MGSSGTTPVDFSCILFPLPGCFGSVTTVVVVVDGRGSIRPYVLDIDRA